jgi:hypothetical protein
MGSNPTMPTLRPIPIVIACLVPLVAWAQIPAPDQVTPPAPVVAPIAPPEQSGAELRVNFAIVQVAEMKRIAARIDMTVDMLNQKFRLEGNYYKDTGNRLRLQLNLVGLGDTDSKMLQVCDGKILWDFQQVLQMQSCRKREIVPILDKLKNPDLDANFKFYITSNLGFGGPEAMLSGLRKSVAFDQISDDKLDGLDVVVVRGTWRDRSTLLNANDRPLPLTAPLPPYVPANIAIYLGKIDGWPYKIEMIGNAPSLLQEDTREIDKATGRPIGRPIKPPKVDPTRITLRYKLLDVTEITAGLFHFEPPASVAATSIKDDTQEFLEGLDQFIAIEMAKKKEAAAKAGDEQPLLKAPPIELPTPPGADVPSPK